MRVCVGEEECVCKEDRRGGEVACAWADRVLAACDFFSYKNILLEPEVPLPLLAVRKRHERKKDRASDKSLETKLKLDRFSIEPLLTTDQHKILR